MLTWNLSGKRAAVIAPSGDAIAAATAAALRACGAEMGGAEPGNAAPDYLVACAPGLPERLPEAREAIVLVASAGAQRGVGGSEAEIREHGVVPALTAYLARRLAPAVRVNALLLSPLAPTSEILERTPMGRALSPEEAAETVLFLLAGNTFITGAVLTLDGGWLL